MIHTTRGLRDAAEGQREDIRYPNTDAVIGPSPRHENLWLAFGHGHTGMVAGPMTGRIFAGMITGPMPNIDVTPYRADRF